MTRFLLFFLGFSIGFSVDVTVDASERVQLIRINPAVERGNSYSSALLEEPKKCLEMKSPCAIRVGTKRKLELESSSGSKWIVGEKTIVVRLSDERLRLVEGSLKVTSVSTVVETEQGELFIRGEAFLDRSGSKMTVVNTGAEALEFKGRGWADSKEIPAGLETQIDLPDIKSGQTAATLPLPFDFDAQVVREARVFSGPKADFSKRLEYLAELRASAAIQSATFHREVIERKMASVAIKEAALREARLKREARDRELRALFRRKVLNPE